MATQLPTGWEERQSKSSAGRPYYFNIYTKATQWDPPATIAPDQVSLY